MNVAGWPAITVRLKGRMVKVGAPPEIVSVAASLTAVPWLFETTQRNLSPAHGISQFLDAQQLVWGGRVAGRGQIDPRTT